MKLIGIGLIVIGLSSIVDAAIIGFALIGCAWKDNICIPETIPKGKPAGSYEVDDWDFPEK